jgi:putative phage-type endonuclease
MKTLNFEDKNEWMSARKGKITGSRLNDIILKKGGGYKKGYYELIAERIEIEDQDGVVENPMERGHQLEPIALEKFKEQTGKDVDNSLVIWTRDDNEKIAVSPDGFIGETEAVECKCLNSASHIEALLTGKIPKEYEMQVLQYFIVNDKLEKLYFVFYDPRIPAKEFFYYEVKREDIADKITEYLTYETELLAEIDKIVADLIF